MILRGGCQPQNVSTIRTILWYNRFFKQIVVNLHSFLPSAEWMLNVYICSESCHTNSWGRPWHTHTPNKDIEISVCLSQEPLGNGAVLRASISKFPCSYTCHPFSASCTSKALSHCQRDTALGPTLGLPRELPHPDRSVIHRYHTTAIQAGSFLGPAPGKEAMPWRAWSPGAVAAVPGQLLLPGMGMPLHLQEPGSPSTGSLRHCCCPWLQVECVPKRWRTSSLYPSSAGPQPQALTGFRRWGVTAAEMGLQRAEWIPLVGCHGQWGHNEYLNTGVTRAFYRISSSPLIVSKVLQLLDSSLLCLSGNPTAWFTMTFWPLGFKVLYSNQLYWLYSKQMFKNYVISIS